MSTVVADAPESTRYEITSDGALAGFARYRKRGDEVALLHTEIDSAYAGQGLAKILIRETLDDVREQGLNVAPYCPFVKGFIQKNPEYLDLVSEENRARFDL